MADLVAEIDARMDEHRARSRQMRIARRAYDRWRTRIPWRWVPDRLHAWLFRRLHDLQVPTVESFISEAERHREAVSDARRALHAPDLPEADDA